ncbi:NTP transferase domain-containing protein [Pseudoxanthomonas sp.]|uniref:NTP transferase domain-containing protein n=1 Tax=Pseudoxanthomonas sp. TaxID=1871049 RepID=UPI00262F32FA|nr:NTP transferase domain-containing protein [Pseudoxanthomonas sp.]WDS37745.1 MAG: NTP transferase domain-containing protein [Pseudoxanthomonas sp.]
MTFTDAPLHGLVLAGGYSTRMGRDKAQLSYGRQPQLQAAFAVLQTVVAHCHVSVRADQRDEPLRARFPQIVDARTDIGPAAGLLAAHAAAPEAAWLAVACDLPLLDADTLEQLIAAREPGFAAIAFRSAHDGLAEPLCAIWEPLALQRLQRQVDDGRYGLRSVLAGDDVRLLPLPTPHVLDNANTPDDRAALLRRSVLDHG